MYVPDVVKNLNIKVFNLMARTNETRYMKCVSVNVDKMQVFVIINNVERMINAGLNVKNWLIKVYMMKDLFGILVTVNVNVINRVMLENIQIIKIVSVGKKLADKLVEECTENNEEVKIAEHKNKCSSCILYIALFSIFFAINIRIGTYFVYYKYTNHNKENVPRYDYVYQPKKY